MLNFLLVFVGAGLGGAARYAVNSAALVYLGPSFPFGTLVVNVFGSLVMGLFAGWTPLLGEHLHAWRLILTTGFLGGFTTFSAFSLDVVMLHDQGKWLLAAFYAVASVGFALAGLFIGIAIARALS
ncbi:MAG TPA: fluoride efflux transporter CrcB [Burkholderiaceae bacterium]|mgnify:CR=1 FL=1|nr:fluoride efflux transporter CrcB [Burkholderiaceae bacterium]